MPGSVTLENLDEVFTYHKPDEERARKHETINEATKELTRLLPRNLPGQRRPLRCHSLRP